MFLLRDVFPSRIAFMAWSTCDKVNGFIVDDSFSSSPESARTGGPRAGRHGYHRSKAISAAEGH